MGRGRSDQPRRPPREDMIIFGKRGDRGAVVEDILGEVDDLVVASRR